MGKAATPRKSNSQVAYLGGGAPATPQQAAAPSTAGNQEGMSQFGTIPARINVLGGAVEPNRVGLGFSLNQMEPEYVQPTIIAELTPLRPLGLNIIVPARPSPSRWEVTPVTPSERREALTSATKKMYGATTVAAASER